MCFGKLALITSQLSRRLSLSQRALVGFEGAEDWEFHGVFDGMMGFYLAVASKTLDGLLFGCSRDGHGKQNRWVDASSLGLDADSPSIAKDAADLFDVRLLKAVCVLTIQAAESSGW